MPDSKHGEMFFTFNAKVIINLKSLLLYVWIHAQTLKIDTKSVQATAFTIEAHEKA